MTKNQPKKNSSEEKSQIPEMKKTNEAKPINPNAISLEEYHANGYKINKLIMAGFMYHIKTQEPEPIMHTKEEFDTMLEKYKNTPTK